jgi:hypothetical protein
VRGQRHAPAATYPRERPNTHCTGGWVGLRAGLENLAPTGIRSLDRPASRQSLYRLHYPAHHTSDSTYVKVKNIQWAADRSVGIATCYGLDGPEIESRWGARFSAPVQTNPVAYPASYTMGTWSFMELKRPRRGVDHPPLSSTKLKERVQLYLKCPSGFSWPALGWTAPVPLALHLVFFRPSK